MSIGFRGSISRIDWWMLSSVLVLVGFGLTLIYSLTWPQDDRFVRQVIFLILGIALFFALLFFDIHFWRNASFFIYAFVLIFLIGLLVFGDETKGARAWIDLGPIGIQPAEFMKIAAILFLSTTLERLKFDLAKVSHLVFALLVIAIPFALIALQPDLGSAFIILFSGLVMILYTGLDKRKIISLLLIGVVGVTIGWFGVLQDYQKERVITFLNPQSDPLGTGYNVLQSIVAIGSGGVLGKGLGLGTQSQLNFLPEQETDFIFASLAEELGFVGAGTMLLIYLFFLWRLFIILREGKRPFSNFLVLGIFMMFFSQAIINIGMNMGIFPVTGITLPFLSYGGSSLIASFWGLSIVMKSKT